MRVLLCAVAAALLGFCASAQADDTPEKCDLQPAMSFTAWSSTLGQQFGAGARDYIFADGYLCNDTDQKFQQFLDQNPPKSPNTVVVLNSGGGDVNAGLRMGGIIRKAKMWTQVGSRYPLMIGGNQNIPAQAVPFLSRPSAPPFPGYCYSTCTFIFMGGVQRTIDYGSNYGVHRFHYTEPISDVADEAQISSAAIVQYITEMGISPDYMVEMVKQGGNNVTNLSMKVMQQLKIVTPKWQSKWRFTPLPDNSGFFLDGKTDDFWGDHEIAFTCAPKAVLPSLPAASPDAAAPTSPPSPGQGTSTTPPAAPLLLMQVTLDPGERAKAQDVVGAVQSYVLELGSAWEALAESAVAQKIAVDSSNHLSFTVNVSKNGLSTLETAPNIGFAIMFDPAAKLQLRLLQFEATLDAAKLKQFAATCH